MPQPYEIVAAPFEAYIAPVGESFPATNTSPPGGNWTLLGTSGDRNITQDGVSVSHDETVEDARMLGSTGPVKSFRTEESLTISLTLADISLEQYKYVLDFNSVTDNSGSSPPNKEIDTYKGDQVATRALLVRGPSPYDDSLTMQYEVPRVRASGTPEVVYQLGTPAGLAIAFFALIDLNASSDAKRFGVIRAQTGT